MSSSVRELEGSARAFAVDRENSAKHVAIEFLSQRDYHAKAGGPYSSSTVQSYDFQATAKTLASEIQNQAQDKLYLGVLYDPLSRPQDPGKLDAEAKKEWERSFVKAYRQSQAQAATESKRLLRLQVQDFVKWLAAQGAI